MIKILNICILIWWPLFLAAQNPLVMNLKLSHFEINNNYTPTYEEIIAYYSYLSGLSPFISMKMAGKTDSGKNLHEIVLSKYGFEPDAIKKKNLPVLLINNGIHPGEPCGIDASILLVKKVISEPALTSLLDSVVIVIIPVYNIGGTLNRSATSRANQLGPEQYGFRGNARNYDLNRDFIKADAANTRSFHQIFTKWDPDIFVDTHTSNGADYQYTMTLIATQGDKLGAIGQKFLEEDMIPALYRSMEEKNWEMIPYVYSVSLETPDQGIMAFLDYPRYSSGYAALHHTWSFMPEAHMLKPYRDRVYSTLAFLESMASFIRANSLKIQIVRKAWKHATRTQTNFPLQYKLNKKKVDSLSFKGYTAAYKTSKVTGQDRLYYDREKPFTKNIPYYKHYDSTVVVAKPAAYVIPQGYTEIIEKLKEQKIFMYPIAEAQNLEVEKYKITGYQTSKSAYEGHYVHSDIRVEAFKTTQTFEVGDIIVPTDQEAVRFIVETLEPHAPDSYFAWNFFDAILQQKEHFSAYVFEDLASEILEKDQVLLLAFNKKKTEEPEFAKDAGAQLEYIYKHSPYYEPTHMVYPIARKLK